MIRERVGRWEAVKSILNYLIDTQEIVSGNRIGRREIDTQLFDRYISDRFWESQNPNGSQ